MKKLNCHGDHNVTTLPGRVIWFAGGGEAPKLPDKESQKEFSEITKTVKDLENEKSNVKEEHDKVVGKLVKMLTDQPEYFSTELLRALAKRGEVEIRREVADAGPHYTAPVDVLRKLAKDEDVIVRQRIATSLHTPADVLRELTKDEYMDVRLGVAENSHTPVDTLRELAKNEYVVVRLGVAGNSHTPADILHELAKDENQDVAKAAKERLK